jgi:hypothetical protein
MTIEGASFYITVNGKARRLLRFMLTGNGKDGSVTLRNYTGPRKGFPPDFKVVNEERYTVHISAENPDFSLINYHSNYKDQSYDPNMSQATSVIKRKSGFAHIITTRYTGLNGTFYDLSKASKNTEQIELMNFPVELPSTPLFILSIFVGDKDTEFEPSPAGFPIIKTFTLSRFKFVFLFVYLPLPGTTYAKSLTALTCIPGRDPKIAKNHLSITNMSVADCYTKARCWTGQLLKDYLLQGVAEREKIGSSTDEFIEHFDMVIKGFNELHES